MGEFSSIFAFKKYQMILLNEMNPRGDGSLIGSDWQWYPLSHQMLHRSVLEVEKLTAIK